MSHSDFVNLTTKFRQYGFSFSDYSVPKTDPFDLVKITAIKAALKEQIRQCNYFIIFANMAQANSDWCKFEISVATEYAKPILSVKPFGYAGNIPLFIQYADNQGGAVGFHTPAIIRKICSTLSHPLPVGI